MCVSVGDSFISLINYSTNSIFDYRSIDRYFLVSYIQYGTVYSRPTSAVVRSGVRAVAGAGGPQTEDRSLTVPYLLND